MQQYQMKITENISLVKDIYRMSLTAEQVDVSGFAAGCFVHIKINDGALLLRRPISLYEVKPEESTIRIIYKRVGKGTDLLTKMKIGEELNVLGPLGNGFPILENTRSVLLAGGGVGVPPLYELGKRLRERQISIVSVLGFQDVAGAYAMEEFQALGKVLVSTMDGSLGQKGTILDVLNSQEIAFDTLYACGPNGMLQALDLKYRGKKRGYLSFEERMACGIGACYGCMLKTNAGLKRVCKDGPVFALGEVEYESISR